MKRPDSDDVLIAELWLDHFGSPLPMYGAKEIAIQILEEEGVTVPPLSGCDTHQKTKPSSISATNIKLGIEASF